eukprot:TRINITY_DN31729_c0_g1_i1.p1 TRINITY_DN31729_c0_g1~~TRINITY_DN31729_c0_g1_i1.p1  ORF type:complete len:122 (-),score=22.57 TRINITY_DN31729_c0_g1_i1:32-397(-)
MLRSLVGSEMCIRDRDRVLRVNLELVHVFANVGILERTAREAVPVSQAPATTTESATRLRLHVRVSPDSLARHATLCAPHPEVFGVVGTAPVTVSYTHSDAADEEDSVDLGGRRVIKKKKN